MEPGGSGRVRQIMHLVEILLPLRDSEGHAFADRAFERVKEALTARFGGVTAFARSPAEGVWRNGDGRERDEIVVVQVMSDSLDRGWWAEYRAALERDFRQDEIVIRALAIERL